MDDKLIKEIKGNVAYIWINRPDKKNALDSDVWFGLPKIIEEMLLGGKKIKAIIDIPLKK